MRIRSLLLCIVGLALLLYGGWSAWVESETVFNSSYMMTLDALGEPGATQKIRLQFIGLVAIAVAGIVLLILGYKHRKTPK